MIIADLWCRAVEDVWLTQGPGGLSVRTVSARARHLAEQAGLEPLSNATVIYSLRDNAGDIVFGDFDKVITYAHRQAIREIDWLIGTEVASRTTLDDKLDVYAHKLVERPAWRQMLAHREGPNGPDRDLIDLSAAMTRTVGSRGRLAAVHGIIEAVIVESLGKPRMMQAIREVAG